MTDISRRFSVTVSADSTIPDKTLTKMLDSSRPPFRRGTVGFYSCDRHQGYANYPTFTVALWIKNDAARLAYVREVAQWDGDPDEDNPDVRLAEWLRQYTEETMPESDGDDISGSLLNYVLGTVDWLELARKFMKEEEQ